MYSREDVVKTLLSKKGVDPYSTGGVSICLKYDYFKLSFLYLFYFYKKNLKNSKLGFGREWGKSIQSFFHTKFNS